ncbi:MAG: 4Fe-4S dicluster domain-containing protein [Desulfotomaculum sp.]|nr:4Fe-4S dicluster domain-containing protein [Desulfotomaculum sp.]
MRTVIYTNFDLCTGCAICQMICSEHKTGGTNPRLALLRISPGRNGLIHQPEVCQQCQNAFCLKVCPVEAVYRNKDNGAVIIDDSKCTGCGLCVKACQKSMIMLDKENKAARKCDLCGGDPLCVQFCPTGALQIVKLGGEKDE